MERSRDPSTPEPKNRAMNLDSTPRRKLALARRLALKAQKEDPSSIKNKENATSCFIEEVSSADIAIPSVEAEDLDADVVMMDVHDGTVVRRKAKTSEALSKLYTTPVKTPEARSTLYTTPVQNPETRFTLYTAPVKNPETRFTLYTAPVKNPETRFTLYTAPVKTPEARSTPYTTPVKTPARSVRYTTPPARTAILQNSTDGFNAFRPERTEYDYNVEKFCKERIDCGSWGSKNSFCSENLASPENTGSPANFTSPKNFASPETTATSPESVGSASVFPLYGAEEEARFGPFLQEFSGLTKPLFKPKKVDFNGPLWTPEMNKHLWVMWEIYSADPTVTPWNRLYPPGGVFRRVASLAKKNWNSGPHYEKFGSWPHSGTNTRSTLRMMVKQRMPAPIFPDPDQEIPSPTRVRGAGARARARRDPFSNLAPGEKYQSMRADGPLAQLAREPGKDSLGGFSHFPIQTGRNLVEENSQQKLNDFLRKARIEYNFDAETRERCGAPPYVADTYNTNYSKTEPELPQASKTYSPDRARFPAHYRKVVAEPRMKLKTPPRFSRERGNYLEPVLLEHTFQEIADYRNGKSNLGERSPSIRSPRSRHRPAVSTEIFKTNPVLPPGWSAGTSTGGPEQNLSSPAVIHSDPVESQSGLQTPFTPTNRTAPREPPRNSGNMNRGVFRQAGRFDRHYFRDFNEEQARKQSGFGSADIEMADCSDSDSSSNEED